jgi:fibronectin type 3 domain-containing protein
MRKTLLSIIFVLLASSAFAAQVQLTWNANTETDLAGYKVYYGTAAGTYGVPVDVGNVITYTMTITPTTGATYYFALTAYDTSGNESAKSSEVSVFLKDGTAPAKPTGFMQRLQAWIKALFIRVT